MFEALTQPDRDPQRPWLFLLDDEVPPTVVSTIADSRVVWTSIWRRLPDAIIQFDLDAEASGPDAGSASTRLRWTVWTPHVVADPALVGHIRHRMNRMINADLRATFGQ
ncbi:MAG: hypothetical protein ACTHMS_03305 [Jatrophihabitans sp.]|uniref:hypothetical protein n=1 Tax=Jatrophihabitans sp. TaxID=1932789 RepID=UPI003F7D83AA